VDYLYITDLLSKRYGPDRHITISRSMAFKTTFFLSGNNNHSFFETLKEVYEDKLMSCVKYAAGKPPTCFAQS
jgi:hypothetical protein